MVVLRWDAPGPGGGGQKLTDGWKVIKFNTRDQLDVKTI